MRFQHHMRQFFCHIGWFPYFFLTLDDFILTLCSSNITCNSFFLTLGGSLTFFSQLMVSSSHCAVLTSHVIVLFSHLVVLLSFSHIWWFSYFFLTFDGFILILCGSNITCDSFFLTFGRSFTFFSHI